MDMELNPDELAFRDEVRAFFQEKLPPHLSDAMRQTPSVFVEKDICEEWQTILYKQGWVAPRWPKEFGGPGWSPVQCYIYEAESARASAPALSVLGLKLVGPVIYTYGTQAQKDFYLERILSAQDYWCQGFSEPGSGSDLASLKTRADRDGDHYVVNGTKIWTTHAHHANWMFCLARTDKDVKQQEGISFLLIDMNTPGIEVKPIITMAGDHEVNQVFLDNVRVPVENLVGAEGQGWDIAKFLLANERGSSSAGPAALARLNRLRDQARTEDDGAGGALADDPGFALRLSKLYSEAEALEVLELRILAQLAKGEPLGAQSSIVKLIAANLVQATSELSVNMFGYDGLQLQTARPLYGGQLPDPVRSSEAEMAMPLYLNNRAWTIFGGSDEVQKTILAKSVLGL